MDRGRRNAPRREGSSDAGARGCAAPGAPTHPTRLFHIPRRTRTPTLRPTANPLDVLAIQPSRGPMSGGGRMNMADTSNSPLLPTGSLSRSNCAGPSDEHRQDEESRSNRPVERAKICVAAARRVEISDEMMPFDQHVSRQRYTRLCCRRSGTAFDSLTLPPHTRPEAPPSANRVGAAAPCSPTTKPLATDRSRRSSQGGAEGILSIRHSCEHVRSHARRLNPLARGCLIQPDAKFLLRQDCARVRAPNTGGASSSLTAAVIHDPERRGRLGAAR